MRPVSYEQIFISINQSIFLLPDSDGSWGGAALPMAVLGLSSAHGVRELKLAWREAGPPNHHDDQVDSDQ